MGSGHRGAHNLGELEGAADRLAQPFPSDGAGDLAGKAFFAEFADQPCEIILGKGCDKILGGRPGCAHAHVERPVEPKREAAFGLVELGRGDAKIERDPGNRSVGDRPDQALHVAKIPLDDDEPPAMEASQFETAADGFGVAVYCEDTAFGRREQRQAVAAGAKSAVDVKGAVARRQHFDDSVYQDRHMTVVRIGRDILSP